MPDRRKKGKSKSPKRAIEEIARIVDTFREIQAGLDGRLFQWEYLEYFEKRGYAQKLGYTIRPLHLDEEKTRLKRGAYPIGQYMSRFPHNGYQDLYIVEVHFKD